MRTLRATFAGTVVVALLVGLCGVVGGQTDESAGPNVTYVSGERLDLEVEDAERRPEGEYVRWPDALVIYEWSDPSLPTEMRVGMNVVADHVFSGAVLLEDIEGHWDGTWEAFIGDDTIVHGLLHLTGHGAYDGLIADLHGANEQERDTMSYEGVIVEGERPPIPAMFTPVAEPPVGAAPPRRLGCLRRKKMERFESLATSIW